MAGTSAPRGSLAAPACFLECTLNERLKQKLGQCTGFALVLPKHEKF